MGWLNNAVVIRFRRVMSRFAPLIPVAFVLLWHTGFLGARGTMPHGPALTTLSIRFFIVMLMLSGLAWISGARWPQGWAQRGHLFVAGTLLHGVYLGGVFWAVEHGMGAATSALIVGLQPMLTALLAMWLLAERTTLVLWLGLVFGLAGTLLVVAFDAGQIGSTGAVIAILIALVGISAGSVYQKKFVRPFDWRAGAVWQFAGSLLITVPITVFIEREGPTLTGQYLFWLFWLIIVLSIGAVALLNTLIQSQSAINVASFFYLIPSLVAVTSWLVFGDSMRWTTWIGIGLTSFGVWLATRPRTGSGSGSGSSGAATKG